MSLDSDSEHYPRKFGKYHLLGPLAQGGMGALYLAVGGDRGLERLMVIKTVLPHLADAEYVARFRDEAKVVVKLSHGNLIPVFDAGLVGGELFLAMDFVEGRDLRAVWNRCAKKQVAFPIDIAVYIVKELCRGLAYAHAFPDLNLVHRDISPPNVLVSYTGEVKLTDFGLASSTLKLEKTAPGIIYGKVAYMSPEQARGEKLDGRSDMYASAIVLWELLTGRQLFPPGKDQPQDLLARAKNPEVMRPSKRAPRVPTDLDEICLKALAANKDDRYANCDEMRKALQTWLAQNAPTTDGTRMSTFLSELFAEDITRDRGERQQLLDRVRTRALTMPPSDELRLIVERSTQIGMASVDDPSLADEAPVRKPGSVGRRASDRQEQGFDRRQSGGDRRGGAPARPSTNMNAAGAAALAQQLQDEAEPDLIGQEVDGRYRVIELIGEGGMGKVYLAEHVEIGKRVALKVLHPSYSRMPDLVERFRREARAASKIGHPNIVDVTDSGTTADGSVYFVMEYLEGVELGSVIEREGAIDVARALKITGQICRALAAAHREGIIHRDLKPENIFLVTRDGAADVVKVLDFGIAKTTEAEAARERRLTSPGMAMGTPEYMSPEQAAGRPADARCDVYALGAILYEMVTGLPPYSGDNFMEILTKKATQDPLPPLNVRPELPVQVGDLVMASMARNPDDRPQTMEALEYELNKCLAGRGVAVAQILGMTTDANVVAAMNPGLSMRHYDDSMVVARPPASSSSILLPRAVTHGMSELPGMWSGPAMATGQNALMARLSSAPAAPGSSPAMAAQSIPGLAATGMPARAASVVESAQVGMTSSPTLTGTSSATLTGAAGQQVAAKRSALGVFGWLLLGAVLFGGVGALIYVALGERGEHGTAAKGGSEPASVVQPGSGSGSPSVAPAIAPPTPDAAVAPSSGGSAGSGGAAGSGSAVEAVGSADDGAASGSNDMRPPQRDVRTGPGAKRPGRDKTVASPKRPTGAAPSAADEPKALLKQGLALERSSDWAAARRVYEKLATYRGYTTQALYRQAWSAFQGNDVNEAVDLAKAAAKENGPYRTEALILFGDALFRQGAPERAKPVYISVRKTASPDVRALMAKKIATCNRAMKLPESNGATD